MKIKRQRITQWFCAVTVSVIGVDYETIRTHLLNNRCKLASTKDLEKLCRMPDAPAIANSGTYFALLGNDDAYRVQEGLQPDQRIECWLVRKNDEISYVLLFASSTLERPLLMSDIYQGMPILCT